MSKKVFRRLDERAWLLVSVRSARDSSDIGFANMVLPIIPPIFF